MTLSVLLIIIAIALSIVLVITGQTLILPIVALLTRRCPKCFYPFQHSKDDLSNVLRCFECGTSVLEAPGRVRLVINRVLLKLILLFMMLVFTIGIRLCITIPRFLDQLPASLVVYLAPYVSVNDRAMVEALSSAMLRLPRSDDRCLIVLNAIARYCDRTQQKGLRDKATMSLIDTAISDLSGSANLPPQRPLEYTTVPTNRGPFDSSIDQQRVETELKWIAQSSLKSSSKCTLCSVFIYASENPLVRATTLMTIKNNSMGEAADRSRISIDVMSLGSVGECAAGMLDCEELYSTLSEEGRSNLRLAVENVACHGSSPISVCSAIRHLSAMVPLSKDAQQTLTYLAQYSSDMRIQDAARQFLHNSGK